MNSRSPTSHPETGKALFGAFCIAFQPLLLNVLSVPAMAYIIRGLGPTAYGQWATATSLIAATGFLTCLGLRGSFIRAVAADVGCAPRATADQLGLRTLVGFLAGITALAVCFFLGYPPVVLYCTAIAAAAMLLQTVAATGIDLFQALQRLPAVAGVNFVAGLVLTIASVVVVALGLGPVAVSVAYLLGPATAALLFLLILHRQQFPVRIHWNLRRFWGILKEARFFAAQGWINTASANAEGVLLPKLVGIEQFSFFSAGSLFANRLNSVSDGLGTALYPAVAGSYRHSPQTASAQVTRFISFGLIICLPLLVLVTFFAGPIAQLLFPANDLVCRQVILITIWALPLMFLDDIIGYALNASGKDATQTRLVLIAGICNLLLAFVLVLWLGLLGACLSWVLRFAVRLALRLPCFIRTFSPRLTRVPLLRLVACAGVMAVVVGATPVALSAVPILGPPLDDPAHWASLLLLVCIEGGFGVLAYGLAVLVLRVVRTEDIVLLLKKNSILALFDRRTTFPPKGNVALASAASASDTLVAHFGREHMVNHDLPSNRFVLTQDCRSNTSELVMGPRVSVVIPTYNYGRFVTEAVDSALAQTLPPHEVIVVDDGSTDDTPQRLAAYGDRIRYLRQENRGLSAARNTGVAAATGDYVALLDSDDAFHPRKLELQAAFLESRPEVGLVGTGSFSDPAARWPSASDAPGRLVTLDDLIIRVRFCPSSAVFRRCLWDRVGPFDPTVNAAADRDYWIRAAAIAPVAMLDAPLTFYRLHPHSMTMASDTMITHERSVLDKAFAIPQLRGRRWLRARAYGLAACSAAYMLFRDSGRPWAAAAQMARSLAWWPLPFFKADTKVFLYRARLALRILSRLPVTPPG